MLKKSLFISAACAFVLTGCGGGSGSSDDSIDTSEDPNSNDPTVSVGVFLDSAVEGLSYSTATQSGSTNADGEFSYLAGEQITFSIGAAQLPAVAAAAQVTPVDIAANSGTPTAMTTNIARLLQSLDLDGNPDNGITIPPAAAASAASINFDVSTDAFENDPAVINLVANSGPVNTSLISAEDANTHLDNTLNGSDGDSQEAGIASAIAGFYDSTVDGGGPFYLAINSDGSAIEYEFDDSQVGEPCYRTTGWTFISLGSSLYRIERPRRNPEDVLVTRTEDALLLSTDSYELSFPSITDFQSSELQTCI